VRELGVGRRNKETNTKKCEGHMKHRIQPSEAWNHYRKRSGGVASKMERWHFWVMGQTGKGGMQDVRKWEKAVQNRSFFPDRGQISHLFPGFPGISHLFPHRFLYEP